MVEDDREAPSGSHEVYWGSHGCQLVNDHNGWCDCLCCDCGPAHPWVDSGVKCVAQFPYYGRITKFYGDSAEWAQSKFDAAIKELDQVTDQT